MAIKPVNNTGSYNVAKRFHTEEKLQAELPKICSESMNKWHLQFRWRLLVSHSAPNIVQRRKLVGY